MEILVKVRVVKNRYWKKIVTFALILINIFVLTGCVEEVELDEKVIIAMVGIDKSEQGKMKVSMGLIDTRLIEEKKEEGVRVYTIESDSIFEAARESILKLGRQPQWPYIKVLVFGPAFKETDIVPVLDFFNRNNEVQPNPKITFSHIPAEEIVKLNTDLANIPAVIVEGQFKHQNLVGLAPDIALHQFTEMMLTPDKNGFAALIEKGEGEDNFIPQIGGTAVINAGKWIGDLTKSETRGLLWVREEVEGGIIVIPSIEGKGKIGLEILGKGKVSIDPLLKNNELSVKINLEQFVGISEVMTYIDLNDQNVEEIKRETEKEIAKEIESTIQKTKKWETDIFDIGRAIHIKYPKYWQENKENWSETFSTLPIDINVQVDIKTMGLLRSLPREQN